MDQQQLSDRLEERVADVPVGAPPIDAMRSAVRRRRGRMTVLGAAAAVAVIAAGGIAWQQLDDPAPQPPVAADPPADPDAPPAGYRYVGIGDVVIAVPETWGTNEIECSTPQEDTVVIDQAVTCLALVPRPADVESVSIQTYGTNIGGGIAPRGGHIDGERAYWTPVVTEDGLTSGAVTLRDGKITFVAESSSEDGRTIVEDLLAGITILENHTTVPGFEDIALRRGPTPAPPMIDTYTTMLENLGLAVEVVTGKSGLKGTVLSTDPAVGSVVAPGDTVTVTVAG